MRVEAIGRPRDFRPAVKARAVGADEIFEAKRAGEGGFGFNKRNDV